MKKIKGIIARKLAGQDCTEDESAQLKQFIKNASLTVMEEVDLIIDIIETFPTSEYSEAICELMAGTDEEKQKAIDLTNLVSKLDSITLVTESNHHSADEVINMIAETLKQSDGKFIAQIANQILTSKVTHFNNKGDDLFELT